MDQKPKRTKYDKRRKQALNIAIIVFVIGLLYAGFSYFRDLQNRAIGNIFSNIVEQLNATDTATPQPVSTYMLTLTAFSITSSPSSLEVGATKTPTPSSPDDNTSINATPICFFNWAYNDAPEHDYDVIELALMDVGYEMANVMIGSFGEDEICQAGSEVVSSRFLLMDITPRITIEVDDTTFNDSSALGTDIRNIVTAIVSIDSLSKIRQIEIDILNSDDAQLWMMKYLDITTALSDEISDDALYELGLQED